MRPGGGDRTAELVYRDGVYYRLFAEKNDNTQFPIHSLFNHEPKKTTFGEDPETFRRYLFLNLSRGTGFVELYLKTHELAPADWDVLAEGLKWVHQAFPAFSRARMIGGDPKKGDVYGFTGCKKEHPEVAFLWQLNAESRFAHAKPEVLAKYFPGHWALHQGAFVAGPVSAGETAFLVPDAKRFSEKGFVDSRSKPPRVTPQDLVLVARKSDGTLDWTKCEYASIVKVDPASGQITVQRGQYGTVALEYGDPGVYIAPIVGSVWAGNRMWFYNFATTCPRDSEGRNAADVFLGEILAKLDPRSGDLRDFDGIAFDIMYWAERIKTMDVNHDGVADGEGIIEGKSVWRDGMVDLLTRLRKKVGSDFLLTADYRTPELQRAVGVMNGMEAEGVPFHHDAFRSFSTPVNHFAYWKKFGVKTNAFNYAAIKYKEEKDFEKAPQYARFATAAAACSDIFATQFLVEDGSKRFPIDELTAGVRNQPRWLGKAVGPMIRLEDTAPDLFEGGGTTFPEDFLARLAVKGGSLTLEKGGILRLQGDSKDDTKPIELTIKDIPRPAGDIVVSFDAKSLAPLAPEYRDTVFPRLMSVRVDGLPDYPEAVRKGAFFNDLGGSFGTKDFLNQRFYFRDLDEGTGDTITLRLTFEGQGGVELRSLRLLAGSQVMARPFENGVVLVNPSFDTKSFDLAKLFPEFKGGYRFLKGRQAPNSGEPVADPHKVEVPPLDGLMLEKESFP